MLLDSNIVIYAADPANQQLRNWIAAQPSPSVSAVTRVEVLGFHRLTDEGDKLLRALFSLFALLPVNELVCERAIILRRQRRMSLGDSLIAATAVEGNVPLVTRNTADFNWISGLTVIDPFTLPSR